MSDVKNQKPANPAPTPKVAPVAVVNENCRFEECKGKKATKFGFCADHYELYMAGVIRGDGKKPLDYAVKLAQHQKAIRKKAA